MIAWGQHCIYVCVYVKCVSFGAVQDNKLKTGILNYKNRYSAKIPCGPTGFSLFHYLNRTMQTNPFPTQSHTLPKIAFHVDIHIALNILFQKRVNINGMFPTLHSWFDRTGSVIAAILKSRWVKICILCKIDTNSWSDVLLVRVS